MESTKESEKETEFEENPFESSYRKRIKEALEAEAISGAANSLFGPLADKYMRSFSNLREELDKSDLNILFRTYLSEMFFVPIIVFIAALSSLLVAFWLIEIGFLIEIIIIGFAPPLISISSFVLMYIYPSLRVSKREESIKSNLPFALNHMAAVSSSGVSPKSMFKLLTNFEEYGEIAKESNKVVRRVEVFGEDITTALREVARETPSEDLKDIFYGMLSTIETGGDIQDFLEEQSDAALFEYRMRRKKEVQNLSTYASFYTAILVAAPLFLVAILAVLNMMGGKLMGFAINDFMKLGIYVAIPVINTIFLSVLALRHGGQ